MNSDVKQVGDRFKWENSCDRVTVGIYMWHKPILLKQSDGKEVCYYQIVKI